MLSLKQRILKRLLDIFLSLIGIMLCIIPIFVLFIISTIVHKEFGFFVQKRVGKKGKLFLIFKIKSLKSGKTILPFGKFIRKNKLDELPQLLNVFLGSMSIVGPRPDIKGYADVLDGANKIILNVKPGLTSLATLKFANEEELLAKQTDARQFNDFVLWPEKVKLNTAYVNNYSFKNDIVIIIKTILTVLHLK